MTLQVSTSKIYPLQIANKKTLYENKGTYVKGIATPTRHVGNL